jgi:hypothetical protein
MRDQRTPTIDTFAYRTLHNIAEDHQEKDVKERTLHNIAEDHQEKDVKRPKDKTR